jgi:hypothetical protein
MKRFHFIILFVLFGNFLSAQLLQRPQFSDEPGRRSLIPYDAVINYLPLTRIYDITEGPTYYYLATDAGIWRYHKYDREWDYPVTTAQGLPENTVTRIYYRISSDLLYAETPGYRCFFNPTWKLWQNHSKNTNAPFINNINMAELEKEIAAVKKEKIKSIGNTLPRQATFPNDRRYTMGADGTLISPEGERFKLRFSFTSFREDIIFVIDKFGVGLSTEYDLNFDLFRLSLPDIRLRDLFIDGDLFWFGGVGRRSDYGAIALWPNLKESWIHYYKKNSSAFAFSFAVNRFYGDSEDIFAATDNGILRYENGNDEWLTIPGTANKAYSNISRIVRFGRRLWLGSHDGLAVWDLDLKQFIFGKNPLRLTRIYDVKRDGNRILVAANEGLFEIKNGYEMFPQPVDYLKTVVGSIPEVIFTDKRELWLGTKMGWIIYDKKKGTWKGQLLSNLTLKGNIRDIAADRHNAFIALANGIIHWNRDKGTYRWLNVKIGIVRGGINRVIIDGDAIWCLTEAGATQIFYNEIKY